MTSVFLVDDHALFLSGVRTELEDVIAMIRAGCRGYVTKSISSKELADALRRLDISTKTVETHVSSVLRKLQLSNRHELARWATDHRIV
ncbi:MAG: LuxR C-terminal-related transcriptional regulator [Actinomycetota bacterium]|nr:LuxR C-terminal-related transcriptional regulator [Actinomycetota bacterium]MDK1103520.1 LuxR C-terminal-related transcriptional regulator [Actinomycetota bacterium]